MFAATELSSLDQRQLSAFLEMNRLLITLGTRFWVDLEPAPYVPDFTVLWIRRLPVHSLDAAE